MWSCFWYTRNWERCANLRNLLCYALSFIEKKSALLSSTLRRPQHWKAMINNEDTTDSTTHSSSSSTVQSVVLISVLCYYHSTTTVVVAVGYTTLASVKRLVFSWLLDRFLTRANCNTAGFYESSDKVLSRLLR